MVWLIVAALVASSALASAQTTVAYDANIVGTWSTKSNKTFTGPGFYDPVNEKMFEPSRTGISYSFTEDGYYEEAYYRAVSNPSNPACPQGIMQWQHGTYAKYSNGSLVLTPFAVDGRQLTSDPCNYDNSIYMRYNQSEMLKSYEYEIDPYHGIPRLNLYKFDGSAMAPMYIAYKPPQMLPTSTLNPTTTSTTAGAQSTGSSKMKRGAAGREEIVLPLNHMALKNRKQNHWVTKQNVDRWWWFGAGTTALGGVLYFFF